MPAMSNILLRNEDGTTDLTLLPLRDSPFPVWRGNDQSLPLEGQVRLEVQYETLKNKKTRVNVKLIKPIMAVIPAGTVNSAGQQAMAEVIDEESISTTFFLSPRGGHATRAALARHNAHLMVGANVSAGSLLSPSGSGVETWLNCSSTSILPYAIVNLLFPGT